MRRRAAAALTLVAGVVLAGCAPAPYDDVLWRQIDAQQAGGLWNRLADLRTSIEPFTTGILTHPEPADGWVFWDGASDPDIDPDAGATVVYDVAEGDEGTVSEEGTVSFDVLYFSGPRHGDGEPYAGPDSIYTCEKYRLWIVDGLLETVRAQRGDDGLTGPPCPSGLVEVLGEQAVYAPPGDFDG